MKKSIGILVLLLLCCILVMHVNAAPSATLTTIPKRNCTEPGTWITYYMVYDDPGANTWNLRLSWDPAYLGLEDYDTHGCITGSVGLDHFECGTDDYSGTRYVTLEVQNLPLGTSIPVTYSAHTMDNSYSQTLVMTKWICGISQAPEIIATVPANSATGIDPIKEIEFTCSEPCGFNENDPTNKITIKDSDGGQVFFNHYQNLGNTVRLGSDSSWLGYDKTYTVTVEGIKDNDGNPMAGPYSWTFDTNRAHPSPEFPSVFLPVTMIIGFIGAVFLINRTKE